MKRKSIGQKLRFEVFKRDSFTCQYCGSSAPSVILHIDHIHPVSKGGKNTLMNLITSCQGCNSGKSDRVILDDSAISKAKAQADAISERKNQLELMAQWYSDLDSIVDQEVDIINTIISKNLDHTLNDFGRNKVAKMIKKHGLQKVIDASRSVASKIIDEADEDFDFCAMTEKKLSYDAMPFAVRKSNYIGGVIRRRFGNRWEWMKRFKVLTRAIFEQGEQHYQEVYSISCNAESIDKARDQMLDFAESIGFDYDNAISIWDEA